MGSPAQIILSGSALLDSEGTAGVNTPISSEVLTLFDKSGSSGIVILAVIVYGPTGVDKSRGARLDPPTALKLSGNVNVCEPPGPMVAATSI